MRQVQRGQNQIGGFIARIAGAVAEEQPGVVETADGKADQIAHSEKMLGGLVEHVGTRGQESR